MIIAQMVNWVPREEIKAMPGYSSYVTGPERSPCRRICRHWPHRNLTFEQFPVPLETNSPTSRPSRFHWMTLTFHELIEAEWRIYASVNYTIIGSDNGLSTVRQQPIIWTNYRLLSIKHEGTYFNETLFEIQKFTFKKMHMKMSSAKMAAILFRPQCVNRA